ncbi:beta-ketoacyl-ACP reductase [Salinigranum salinum]|uniref:beta-ketoacyl-ACP reductase n=1 Tax=Salinigranum salinum TaxID=1364937 RepID=UPI001260D053|nr:beta-ketoacyl-ACP reductase [Salinigranum salinum]
MKLEDRTCVITGASRGIGRGIAEEMAGEGANVVINYRSSEEEARETVETIHDAGGDAIMGQADVTNYEAVGEMREEVLDAFGPADILINNAGITKDTTFSRMSPDEWKTVIDVNLNGTFNATKVFFDDIKSSDQGRLINISSIVGKQGNFGQANYATAKSGIFGFTRTLALELAPSGSTANSVAPGFTRTDMLAEVRDDIQERILAEIPMGRFAEVEDVSHVVKFLASEEASYITGEVIDVNGAMDL